MSKKTLRRDIHSPAVEAPVYVNKRRIVQRIQRSRLCHFHRRLNPLSNQAPDDVFALGTLAARYEEQVSLRSGQRFWREIWS